MEQFASVYLEPSPLKPDNSPHLLLNDCLSLFYFAFFVAYRIIVAIIQAFLLNPKITNANTKAFLGKILSIILLLSVIMSYMCFSKLPTK